MIFTQTSTYEELCRDIQALSQEYKDFTTLRVIGKSHDERKILMFRIGLGIESLVLTGGSYGRDHINPELFVSLAKEYCKAYQEDTSLSNFNIRQLLNRCSICLIPLVNPDGFVIVQQGFDAIQNPILRQYCKIREIEHQQWMFNAKGVDVHANFPCKSYVQQQVGEYPASEPETRAVMKVFEEYDTVGYLDFQSRGRITYYFRQVLPFAYTTRYHPAARFMQKISDYCIGKQELDAPKKGGGTPVNYYSEFMKKPALTIETLEPSQQMETEMENIRETYREMHTLPLKIIQKL